MYQQIFPTQIHNYSTRFTQDYNLTQNLQIRKAITQRSIRSQGVQIWNNLPPIIQNNIDIIYNTFFKKVKIFLAKNQNLMD